MTVDGISGKFYYKALLKVTTGYMLSENYYASLEDAQKQFTRCEVLWPAEEITPGIVYVPSKEEMEA